MRKALYAGSFNPFTIGHLSVLKRGLQLFDTVIVMIGINSSKNESRLSAKELNERLQMIDGCERARVIEWDGLTVDAARHEGARWLLRGARSVADFEYEKNLADINRRISGIETVILLSEPDLSMISSSMVRELERFGHDTSDYIV